jgi:hypothetical protein
MTLECITAFNVFAYFWHEMLELQELTVFVQIWHKVVCIMLEFVRLVAKFLC